MQKSKQTQGEGNSSVLLWMLFSLENHSFFYTEAHCMVNL